MQAVGLGEENRERGFLRRRELEAEGASLRILAPPFKNQEEKGCESLRGQVLPSMHKSLSSNTSTAKTSRKKTSSWVWPGMGSALQLPVWSSGKLSASHPQGSASRSGELT